MAYQQYEPNLPPEVRPEDILFTTLAGHTRLIRDKSPHGQVVWRIQRQLGGYGWKNMTSADGRDTLWRELERLKMTDPALTSFIKTQLPYRAT